MRSALIATVAASALAGGAAWADGHKKQCFDKGSLTYFDCPEEHAPEQPAPAPAKKAVVDESGFYLGLTGGAAFFTETDFDVSGTGNIENEYDTGYAIQGQIGYEFDDLLARGVDLRVDLEAGYMTADVESHELGGVELAGPTGDTNVFTLTTNAYLDFNATKRLDLFVGGGAGVGFVEFDNHGVAALPNALDDDETAFAFHLDAGASVDVTSRIVLEARYRYAGVVGADLTSTNGTESSVDVDAHQALAGVRLKF